MGAMPFTAHGFTLRPVDELIALLRHVGFHDVRDERVGTDDRAFHLLVQTDHSTDHLRGEVRSDQESCVRSMTSE